ncbi:hypothetical protein D9M71_601030 [compost metagenome]
MAVPAEALAEVPAASVVEPAVVAEAALAVASSMVVLAAVREAARVVVSSMAVPAEATVGVLAVALAAELRLPAW